MFRVPGWSKHQEPCHAEGLTREGAHIRDDIFTAESQREMTHSATERFCRRHYTITTGCSSASYKADRDVGVDPNSLSYSGKLCQGMMKWITQTTDRKRLVLAPAASISLRLLLTGYAVVSRNPKLGTILLRPRTPTFPCRLRA
jgi:hypothetical protein